MQKSELEVGDYVEYRYRDIEDGVEKKGRGYIGVFRKFGSSTDIAWIENDENKNDECIVVQDILRKVPPPSGDRIQRDVTRP